MIQLGKFNDLKVSKAEDSGYTLIDDEGTEIFLPSEKTDKELEEGATVSVFVYPGILGAKKATLKKPLIALGEFAFLTVSSTDEQGVYVDWGMEKDLLIPPKQEGERMEEGESYIIFMYQDRESGKLYGSNKIEKRLSNDDLTIEEGEEVDVMVQRESDMGFAVIVNHRYRGLVFENEVFQDLLIGDTLKGYVKKIQPENRLDITIRPMGYRNTVDPDVQTVLNALEDNQSFLPLTDKSKPDLIMVELNMSKKAFKRAIGSLYKERKIEIKEDGIHLI
jgi:predicted RNA-binding protein (virulence factor B family)|tara:strand:+ start:3182 stop:4015 length:834 start_codon:yes stop_codon:yes gene_type:complete